MKHFLLILSIILIEISFTYAQPYSVNLKVSIPTDCNGGTDVLLYNESGLEGLEFLIPEQTLPSQISSFQSYYDVFAGGIVAVQQGALNENVTLNVNLEFFKCSPDNPQLFELIRMSIIVEGENTGSHDVFTYYNFNEGKKAFIKLKAQKLFNYLQNAGVTLDELVAWFYGEGFTPDVTGISYKYDEINDPDWFYIYLDHFSKIILGTMASPTVVEHSDQLPAKYNLEQNYPNPFNPTTKINYTLPIESNVQLLIFTVTGELVKTLVNEKQSAGSYNIDFDASKFASGMYIYKLIANDFIQLKKMILLR